MNIQIKKDIADKILAYLKAELTGNVVYRNVLTQNSWNNIDLDEIDEVDNTIRELQDMIKEIESGKENANTEEICRLASKADGDYVW